VGKLSMNTTGSPGSPSFTHGYVTDDSRSSRSHVMPAIEHLGGHVVRLPRQITEDDVVPFDPHGSRIVMANMQ